VIAKTTIKRISPMLSVADMEITTSFYCEVLLFDIVLASPNYTIVGRDGMSVHLHGPTPEDIMHDIRGHVEIYIEVDDIETLWEHVKSYNGRFRIRDLFDRDYGMTEFHIADPDDCLVFIGQVTQPKS
jgi:catechol 2,3-dioxygenase-like lactoylglutathione lyase family enzyme